jgi:suppressor of fused
VNGWLRRLGGRPGPDPVPEWSPGVAAIDDHVNAADGGPEVDRVRPRSRRRRAPPPLDEITIHEIRDPHHWHLVTYGLSDLQGQDTLEPETAGWGFELTFRVREEGPPRWAVDLLTSLAAYVWSSRHPFAEGHNVDLRGPIRLDAETGISAAMIIEDPVLGILDGPFGRVQFLQVVGITAGELELCRSWTTDGVRDLLGQSDPLLVTRLDRLGVDEDPGWADEIQRRRAEEGSSLHELRVATLRVHDQRSRGTVAEMGAGAASALGPALRRELLATGAVFTVIGDDCHLRFVAAEAARWSWTGGTVEVAVPVGLVGELATLFDGRAGWRRLPDWPGLTFRVVE